MYTKDESDRRIILAALDYQVTQGGTLGHGGAKALADELRRGPRPGFHLSIEMGNAEMLTVEHVAEAVRRSGDSIEAEDGEGKIYDANGNQVGTWTLILPQYGEYQLFRAGGLSDRWVPYGVVDSFDAAVRSISLDIGMREDVSADQGDCQRMETTGEEWHLDVGNGTRFKVLASRGTAS